MNKNQQKHIIKLSVQQKRQLQEIINKGKHKSRDIKRAQILLKSNQGIKDKDIAVLVGTSERTVERVRQRFTEEGGGLKKAIYELPRSGQPLKLDDAKEAKLVAIACSNPPEGASVWTLELLQRQLIKDRVIKGIGTATIWRSLKGRGIKPWLEKNVVHSQADSGVHRPHGAFTGSLQKAI
jgi:transposase